MPTIVGQPHACVSEPLQALLPAAWARLVGMERAEAVDRAAVLAKAAGLNPAEVVARMTESSPVRPPLGQVVQCSMAALALGQRLVPLPPQKPQQKATVQEKVVKNLLSQQQQPTEMQSSIDEKEKMRRKRQKEEEEKAAQIEAGKDQIYEQ